MRNTNRRISEFGRVRGVTSRFYPSPDTNMAFCEGCEGLFHPLAKFFFQTQERGGNPSHSSHSYLRRPILDINPSHPQLQSQK